MGKCFILKHSILKVIANKKDFVSHKKLYVCKVLFDEQTHVCKCLKSKTELLLTYSHTSNPDSGPVYNP